MAATINVKVDVADSAFTAFASKFKAYTDKLDTTPGAWAKVSRSSEESTAYFEALAAAISDQAEAIGKIAAGSTTLRQSSEATARHWHGLNISTKGVAANIKEATVAILKWTAITSVVSAITGGIAAHGFGNIADSVSSQRTAAMGLGATYGGRSSFLVNFRRMTDPEGFLSRVNEVAHRADNVPLRALGLTQAQSQGDTSDVATNVILMLKKLVGTKGDGQDERFLANKLHAVRADELATINQALALRGISLKEVEEMVLAERRDKSRLALGTDSQRKYQDFTTRMSAATKKIENTFVKNLGQLTPGMTKLATATEHVIDVLMQKDGPLSQWLGVLNTGIERFARYIDTPEFQGDVEGFVSWIGKLASATGELLGGVLSFAKWIGVTPAEAATSQQQGTPGINGMTPHSGGGGGTGGGGTGPSYGGGGLGGGMATGKRAGWGNTTDQQVIDTLADVEREEGLPSGTLRGIYAGEGRNGFVGDHGTSFNWGQFHRAPNGKAMGDEMVRAGVNIYDNSPEGVRKTARWVARELKRHPDRRSEFHGNKGAGRGQQLRPSETTPRAPANTSTRITITKPTGSDASTAAAAAATQ